MAACRRAGRQAALAHDEDPAADTDREGGDDQGTESKQQKGVAVHGNQDRVPNGRNPRLARLAIAAPHPGRRTGPPGPVRRSSAPSDRRDTAPRRG